MKTASPQTTFHFVSKTMNFLSQQRRRASGPRTRDSSWTHPYSGPLSWRRHPGNDKPQYRVLSLPISVCVCVCVSSLAVDDVDCWLGSAPGSGWFGLLWNGLGWSGLALALVPVTPPFRWVFLPMKGSSCCSQADMWLVVFSHCHPAPKDWHAPLCQNGANSVYLPALAQLPCGPMNAFPPRRSSSSTCCCLAKKFAF